MAPEIDFMLQLSQLGLGLAGFAGVLSVFRADDENWLPQELEGLRLILECCAVVVVGGLFVVLVQLVFRSWISIGSALIGLFLCAEVILRLKRMNRAPPRFPVLFWGVYIVPLGLLGIFSIANVFFALPFIIPFALFYMFFVGVFQFGVFVVVFIRHRGGAAADPLKKA